MSESKPKRPQRSDTRTQTGSAELTTVLAGMMASLALAKRRMDETSAEIARVYAQDKVLSAFQAPAFSLSSVQLKLRFAIESVDASGTPLLINVDQSVLAGLPQHLLSEIDIQLAPQPMQVFESDAN